MLLLSLVKEEDLAALSYRIKIYMKTFYKNKKIFTKSLNNIIYVNCSGKENYNFNSLIGKVVFFMYDELVKLISTVGFPISVSVYLLVRFEKKLDNLNKSISDLTAAITTVIENQRR